MRLLEFRARDVYGYLKFDISFNESPVILVGPNGSGKTTSLRLIQALLTPSIRDLLSTDFSIATVILEEQGVVKAVSAKRLDDSLELEVTGVSEALRVPLDLLTSLEAGATEYPSAAEAARVLQVKYSDHKVFRSISEISAPVFLGLDRIPEVHDELLNDARHEANYFRHSPSRVRKGRMLRGNLAAGLLETQTLVQRAYRRVRQVKDEQAERLRRKLLLTGFEYTRFNFNDKFILDSSIEFSEAQLSQRKDDLLAALGSIGVETSDAKRELEPFFSKVIELGRRLDQTRGNPQKQEYGEALLEAMVNKASLSRLQFLINAVRESNQKNIGLSQRFQAFVTCVNAFFLDSRKEIEIDPVGVIRVSRPGKVEIPVEALSSGERQILIIFGHLYFNSFGAKSSVFIIDEPELSLHLRWQEMLLERMIESNPRAQIVVATHSPRSRWGVVGKLRDTVIMLARSEAAKHAKAKFYENFNDIDIFVEDTAIESKKIYCELLTRALGGRFTVTQVFPLGAKNVVLTRCAADQADRKRKAVYLIDGDYDLLAGAGAPALRRLFRLTRYSVENYLCDADAIVDVIADETIKDDHMAVLHLYDFDGWVQRAATPLADILMVCAIAHKYPCGLPTVNVALEDIDGKSGDHVDTAKVQGVAKHYCNAIGARHGSAAYLAERARLGKVRGADDYLFVLRYAPAKTLLLPLLLQRAKRKHHLALDQRLLKCKIARRCDVSELSAIAHAIA